MFNFPLLSMIVTALLTQHLWGFALLSGPDKATLDVNEDNPEINIYWNGSSVSLKDKGKIEGGKWEDLSNDELMEEILRLAVKKWNEVPGSYLKFNLLIDGSLDTDPDDNLHTIVVADETNLTTAASALPMIEDKIIRDCDISISKKSVSAKTLARTLIHELGHCVGLGHAHTNYGAIMSYARDQGDLRLGADDMAGIIYLYPDPDYESEPKEFLACATIPNNSNSAGHLSNKIILLFLLVMPLLLTFYSRKI